MLPTHNINLMTAPKMPRFNSPHLNFGVLNRGGKIPFIFKWIVIALAAIFTGLVATTDSPIAIALLVGVCFGGGLLIWPQVSVWLILAGTLLVNGAIGLTFPSLTKVSWLFSMLGFLLLAGGVLTMASSNYRKRGKVPRFILALLAMMATSVGLSFLGESSVVEILAGTKRTFQLWGLMLAVTLMPVDARSAKRFGSWLKFLFVIGFIQLPAALFERIVLVPQRVGMGNGVVPIDIVSGTFESSLEGGGSSSVMCIFLIVMLAYVFAAWREKALSAGHMMLFAVLLGAPLFIGETKLVLVLLPMMFLLVFATDIRRNPVMAAFAIVTAGILVAILAWVYFAAFAVQNMTPEQQFQKALDYNFGSVGYYSRYSLNRTTATSFWFAQHGLNQPIQTMFGHGIGSSYSGAGTLTPGHLNRQYQSLGINLTGLTTLLWDTGLVGISLFLVALLSAWRSSTRLMADAVSGGARARLAAVQVSLACIAFALLYSNSMFAGMSHETILAFTFGYLAWLVRANGGSLPQDHAHSLSDPRA